MSFIVEFEGYELSSKFVFKEVCISNIHQSSDTDQHFFIKSPHSFKALSDKNKSIVRFCETYLHRIKWKDGVSTFKDFVKKLNDIPSKSTIYTKGEKKVVILESLLVDDSINVTNLEDLGCLPITKLQIALSGDCPLSLHRPTYNCAHEKVLAFKNFLNKNERKDSK